MFYLIYRVALDKKQYLAFMYYFVKTPWWLKKLYGHCIWEYPGEAKKLFLSFDDGPHEEATPFVLDTLKRFNVPACFFCIGKNVKAHPALYRRILMEGHRVGNHTYDHLNGWKVKDKKYFDNIKQAAELIDSDLFRPPYGKISPFQSNYIRTNWKMKIVMWTSLSADFDTSIDTNKVVENVLLSARPGSILIFHDSAKALPRMKEALPKVIEYYLERGYSFETIR